MEVYEDRPVIRCHSLVMNPTERKGLRWNSAGGEVVDFDPGVRCREGFRVVLLGEEGEACLHQAQEGIRPWLGIEVSGQDDGVPALRQPPDQIVDLGNAKRLPGPVIMNAYEGEERG